MISTRKPKIVGPQTEKEQLQFVINIKEDIIDRQREALADIADTLNLPEEETETGGFRYKLPETGSITLGMEQAAEIISVINEALDL